MQQLTECSSKYESVFVMNGGWNFVAEVVKWGKTSSCPQKKFIGHVGQITIAKRLLKPESLQMWLSLA
jgi:hypothetical protein